MSVPRATRWLAIAVGLAVVAVAFVVLARQQSHGTKDASVDAGFARDMSVHHAQAVQMAAYTEDHAPTFEVRALASTIALQQQLEIGQMLGWLEAWGLPRASDAPAMAWMPGHDGHHAMAGMKSDRMPGMASPGELDALLNLEGERLEVRFLQLMIRHHDGGLPMAKAAADAASHEYVRGFAAQVAVSQATESDQMRQMLTERGGKTLPVR